MFNNVVASGYLKNVRIQPTSRGEIVLAQLTQRVDGPQGRCTFTTQVELMVAGSNDPRKGFLLGLFNSRPEGAEYTEPVTIEGSLVTYFDRRPDVSERRSPMTRIQIDKVDLLK